MSDELSPIQAAVNVLSQRFAVIPILPDSKRPAVSWKPYQTRRPTAGELRAWFSGGEDRNLALICGAVSGGLAVLDIDDPRLADQIAQDHELRGETTLVRTPNGGIHLYAFETAGGSHSGPLVPGVADLKARGGYVLAPPSSVDGRAYITLTNSTIMSVPNARDWALELLKSYAVEVPLERSANRDPPTADGTPIPEGTRNTALIALAGAMRRRGASETDMAAALQKENAARCRPPLAEEEVGAIAASAARYPPAVTEGKGGGATPTYRPPPAGDNGASPEMEMTRETGLGQRVPDRAEGREGVAMAEIHETDTGNAVRLVAQHGQGLRYCHPWGRWLVWDGQRWRVDDTGEVYRLAKQTVRSIFEEAAGASNPEHSKRLGLHAIRSESQARIEAMVALARSEPGIPVLPDELDADGWSFNILSGTINLCTGKVRPHRREDLVTKLAPVNFDPEATCPMFLSFLDRIFSGNQVLIAYVQRTLGRTLTGDTGEQRLEIWCGPGANGKSTLIRVMLRTLGDYAAMTAPGLLLGKRQDDHPTSTADLKGIRFAASVEVGEGRRLSEDTVKMLTGGDRLKARRMREDFWSFDPTHKLILACNRKPTIRGTDHAVWRRIKIVPFDVTIPDAEQDPDLPNKLAGESPGILNWLLEGCRLWRLEGLTDPPEIRGATATYRMEQDVVATFIEDCCTVGDDEKVTTKEIYIAYTIWCRDTHEEQLPKRPFGLRLGEQGFTPSRGKGGQRWWKGVGLVTQLALSQIRGDAC